MLYSESTLMISCVYDQGWIWACDHTGNSARPLKSPQPFKRLQRVVSTNFYNCMHWSHALSTAVTLSHHDYTILAHRVMLTFWNSGGIVTTANGPTAGWTSYSGEPHLFTCSGALQSCHYELRRGHWFHPSPSCAIVKSSLQQAVSCVLNGDTLNGFGCEASHQLSRRLRSPSSRLCAVVFRAIVGQISAMQLVFRFNLNKSSAAVYNKAFVVEKLIVLQTMRNAGTVLSIPWCFFF